MTAEEARKLIDEAFGFRHTGFAGCDGGVYSRIWWICRAIELGDYTVEELMDALQATRQIRDVRQRCYEIHRMLELKRLKRMFAETKKEGDGSDE